jgi:hypothetical protein
MHPNRALANRTSSLSISDAILLDYDRKINYETYRKIITLFTKKIHIRRFSVSTSLRSTLICGTCTCTPQSSSSERAVDVESEREIERFDVAARNVKCFYVAAQHGWARLDTIVNANRE